MYLTQSSSIRPAKKVPPATRAAINNATLSAAINQDPQNGIEHLIKIFADVFRQEP